MISVRLYRPSNKTTYDITPLCETVQVSGNIGSCARQCDINTTYSLYDKNHYRVFPSLGDLITIYEGKTTIFFGMIMYREMSSEQTVNFTSYDPIIHLTKSTGSYNFKKTSAESIANTVAKEAGMNVGNIISTGQNIDLIVDGESLYDVIMKAYTKASIKTKKQYLPIIMGSKFNVIEKGTINTDIILSTDANITAFNYTDNIEEMINRIKIFDENGKYLGKVDNSTLINAYGIFQNVIQKEEGVNPSSAAKDMITGSTQGFTLDCRGVSSCKTGYGVRVQVPYIDLVRNQNMFIDGDSHVWNLATGDYNMQLQLSFKNEMDKRED